MTTEQIFFLSTARQDINACVCVCFVLKLHTLLHLYLRATTPVSVHACVCVRTGRGGDPQRPKSDQTKQGVGGWGRLNLSGHRERLHPEHLPSSSPSLLQVIQMDDSSPVVGRRMDVTQMDERMDGCSSSDGEAEVQRERRKARGGQEAPKKQKKGGDHR